MLNNLRKNLVLYAIIKMIIININFRIISICHLWRGSEAILFAIRFVMLSILSIEWKHNIAKEFNPQNERNLDILESSFNDDINL